MIEIRAIDGGKVYARPSAVLAILVVSPLTAGDAKCQVILQGAHVPVTHGEAHRVLEMVQAEADPT